MAATQVSQQLAAVAGMATNPLSPVAKAAQGHLLSVIKAKKRAESQAAIRKAVAIKARDARIPEKNPEHGKHIWVYKMRGTNQVIYSLTKSIDNDKAMAQLTFVGKKSVPSHIRPDLWNPFAIVTFPTTIQGLDAYQILREFRMRHEYEWRQHLDDDVRNNLPNMRRRKRMLQNQRPNTVADLAATLSLQHKLGEKELNDRYIHLRQKENEYETVQQQLEPLRQRLEPLRAQLAELDEKIEGLNREAKQVDKEAKGALLKEREPLLQEKKGLEADVRSLTNPFSYELARRYHVAAERAEKDAREAAEARGIISSTSIAEEPSTTKNDEMSARERKREAKRAKQELFHSVGEVWVRRRKLEILPQYLSELNTYTTLPKRGPTRARMIRELVPDRRPIPTLNGVKIAWANSDDRYYAETWPEQVEHEIMGEYKSAAPDPERLRADAEWRERVPMLLAMFDRGQETELLRRSIEEWSNNKTVDPNDFVDYMTARLQLAQRRRLEFYHLLRRNPDTQQLQPDQQAIVLEVKAIDLELAAVKLVARGAALRSAMVEKHDQVEQVEVEMQADRDTVEPHHQEHVAAWEDLKNREATARKYRIEANLLRDQAIYILAHAARQHFDATGEVILSDEIRVLKQELDLRGCASRILSPGQRNRELQILMPPLNTRKGHKKLARLQGLLQNQSALRADDITLRAQALRIRALLLAKKDESSNLTEEEEEMLKNVELDGESSGKNEDEVEDDEAPAKSERDADVEEKDVEKENKRQQDEKKSLWGKLFGSSSRDEQPRA